MLSLKDREWAAFPISEIFTIKPGKRLTKSDMRTGDRPFVGATEANNGITQFVSNTNVSVDSDVLGVNYNGSVVETFYHPYECIFSDDVKRFTLKSREGNRLIYLFLKATIVQQKVKYAYGYKFNEQRMSKQSILLPISDTGEDMLEPDWQFMEEYICEREQLLLREYVAFASDNATVASDLTSLAEKEWCEFKVVDYFIPKRGRENNMTSLSSGDVPLISAKNSNNGLKSFVSVSQDRLHQGHTITLNNDGDGGAGLAYYQPFPFALDSHVTSLRPKLELSYCALVFASAAISGQQESFGHAHSISDNRLKAMKMMLPVAADGNPDWDYMEQYAKAMACRQLSEYVSYIGSRLYGVMDFVNLIYLEVFDV